MPFGYPNVTQDGVGHPVQNRFVEVNMTRLRFSVVQDALGLTENAMRYSVIRSEPVLQSKVDQPAIVKVNPVMRKYLVAGNKINNLSGHDVKRYTSAR